LVGRGERRELGPPEDDHHGHHPGEQQHWDQ
jgi:hypothetical protein